MEVSVFFLHKAIGSSKYLTTTATTTTTTTTIKIRGA